jgi:hypothetical protein
MRIASTLAKAAAALILIAAAGPATAANTTGHTTPQQANSRGYRFDLVGTPKPLNAKQHVITVRLVQAMRGMADMTVSGAVLTKAQLDMSPDKMPMMTAVVSQVPSTDAGAYKFAFDNSVWADRGHWALSFSAKLPGEAQPVAGRVVFQTGL